MDMSQKCVPLSVQLAAVVPGLGVSRCSRVVPEHVRSVCQWPWGGDGGEWCCQVKPTSNTRWERQLPQRLPQPCGSLW